MKYFVIILFLIGLVVYIVNNDVYGIYIPETPQELWKQSQIIFVGNITSVKVLEFDKSSKIAGNYTLSLDEYTVNIEEFVKNPLDLNEITVRQPTISLPGMVGGHVSFELGDRVLFYVKNFDGNNTYSAESFKIPKQCDTESVLTQPRITLANNFTMVQDGIQKDDNFTANLPIQFSYDRDVRTLSGHDFVVDVGIIKIIDNSRENFFQKSIQVNVEPCEWIGSAKWDFVPQPGKYRMSMQRSEAGGGSGSSRNFIVKENADFKYPTPGSGIISNLYPIKKQYEAGLRYEELRCNEGFLLIQKYNGSPACVKPETKQHLIDRGWAKTVELNEIRNNPGSLKLNIVRIEDGRVSLYPENTCASIHLDLLSEHDIQRYRNDEKGLDSTNILQITADDLKEIPNIQELIYAVHSIDFPYNKYSSVYLNGSTFVEYEFFLMDKAIKKYGDSQEDYFIKLDKDYEERFTNPAKEGFSNTFEAPVIVYNDKAYSVDGTVFWTSDEHEPRRMGVYPKDTVDEDEKFVTLTDEDMKSVPKIKEAIENIGTIKESVTGFKGLPEDEWNQYREWFEQKSQVQLGTDSFRLIEYNDQLYSVGFGIC